MLPSGHHANGERPALGDRAGPTSAAADHETAGPLAALAAWCGRSLEELCLAGNKLACLVPLRGCFLLRTVDVGRNCLTSLQVSWQHLKGYHTQQHGAPSVLPS